MTRRGAGSTRCRVEVCLRDPLDLEPVAPGRVDGEARDRRSGCARCRSARSRRASGAPSMSPRGRRRHERTAQSAAPERGVREKSRSGGPARHARAVDRERHRSGASRRRALAEGHARDHALAQPADEAAHLHAARSAAPAAPPAPRERSRAPPSHAKLPYPSYRRLHALSRARHLPPARPHRQPGRPPRRGARGRGARPRLGVDLRALRREGGRRVLRRRRRRDERDLDRHRRHERRHATPAGAGEPRHHALAALGRPLRARRRARHRDPRGHDGPSAGQERAAPRVRRADAEALGGRARGGPRLGAREVPVPAPGELDEGADPAALHRVRAEEPRVRGQRLRRRDPPHLHVRRRGAPLGRARARGAENARAAIRRR